MATVVESLVTELNANTAQFNAKLRESARQVDDFKSRAEGIGASGRGVSTSFDGAARGAKTFGDAIQGVRGRLTNVAGDLAATGRVTGELRGRLIDVASDIAAALGPGGLLVGAVGLGTFAIIQYFRKAKEEAKKAAEELRQELDSLLNRGDFAGLTQKARTLFEGTAASRLDSALDESDGIRRLRQALADLDAQIESAGVFGKLDKKTADDRKRIKATLDKLEADFAETRKRILEGEARTDRTVSPITTTVPGAKQISAAIEKAAEDARRKADQTFQDVSRALEKGERDILARRIRVAQALIETGESTVETLRQLIADTTRTLQLEGFSEAQIKPILDAQSRVKDVLKDLSASSKGLKELNDSVKKGNKDDARDAQEAQRLADEALAKAQRAGRAVEDIGRATLAAADAFGVLSDEATKALGAVIDVGAGLTRILAGDVKGGALQGLGGLLTLASQAFGKDPAAEERRRQHSENLAALKEIAQHTGDLVGINTSGRSIDAVRDALEQNLARTAGLSGTRGLASDLARPGALSAATGLSFKEIEELAKSLGITLNGTRQSYLDFLNALKSVDLAAFAEGFAGAIRQLEIEARLDPSAFQGLDGLIRRLKVLAGPDGAPAITKALEGLDLTTSAGRAEAIDRLSTLLRTISSLDVDELGGLSLDQFIEEILSAVEALRAAEPPVTSAFETIAKALAALQDELELLDVTDATERARRIVELVSGLVPAIADALGDVDLTTAEGVGAADEIIRDLFANRDTLSAIERGGLSIEEFTQLLLQLDNALDASVGSLKDRIAQEAEAARRAEEERLKGLDDAARAAEQARAQRIREAIERASNESTFEGDTAIERIQRLVGALGELSPALAGLLEGLDLTTAEGLFEFNARLQALFESLADGADAADLGELSLSELLDVLLELRNGSDNLADALTAVVTAAEAAADRLRAAFSELDFSLELEGISDPLERLKRTALAAASALPEVAAALRGLDLSSAAGRDAAERALVALGQSSTDQAVRDAVLRLLSGIRGITAADAASVAAAAGASAATPEGSRTLQGTPQITAIQADRLLDLQRSQLTVLRDIRDILAPRNATLPPAIPSAFGGAGAAGSIMLRVQNTFNFGTLAGDERTLAQRISDTLLREIDEGLQRLRDRALLANGVTTR